MLAFESDEEILYTARKHWFIFAAEAFFLVVLAVIPAALFFVPRSLVAFFKSAVQVDLSGLVLLFLWCLWLLILWTVLVFLWTDYYLDVWLVTTKRVIDIEQKGMFSRRVSSFSFNQIQDATVDVRGLLATCIGFGTVRFRTASNETFCLRGVARPQELKEKIFSEQHRVRG